MMAMTPTLDADIAVSRADIPEKIIPDWVIEEYLAEAIVDPPPIEHIITEDDTPVDNIPSEKQQRLLTEPLYSSRDNLRLEWPFLAVANVGLYYAINQPAIVPDVFLSLGAQVADDWWEKRHRSYFVWEFGKVPEAVIEIVSNKIGKEDSAKMRRYADIGIPYYVIFDPQKLLGDEILRAYALDLPSLAYKPMSKTWFSRIELGLTLWDGEFEGKRDVWLRWCDEQGEVVPTGKELADIAQQQAEQERQQKEAAQQQVERLTEQLRALGVEPADLD